MRKFLFMIYIALLLLFNCGSGDVAGGSTDTELGNAALSGHLYSRSEEPVSMATVTLFAPDFNPIQNSPVPRRYQTTTDGEGYYQFDTLESGELNMIMRSADSSEVRFREGLFITGDSLYVGMDTLNTPGAAKLFLPDSFGEDTLDLLNGYLFVYGSDFYQRLSEEQIFSEEGAAYIIFDDLPPQIIPAFYYAEEYNATSPLLLVDSVLILSGDTIETTN